MKSEQETYDHESFCAGLRIVSSAKERGVKPWIVWSALRAAMPEEYRTDKQAIAEQPKMMIVRYQRIFDEARKSALLEPDVTFDEYCKMLDGD